ncbi:hypothetical protein OSB04_003259 [Centaurea solstitialis]|uniref:Uncharacterized protein n=1 Tax=Centaurea solstitialis TaxID=347529 RepID=A0AA38UCA8_9ASTR|nr:hypothetical protein OSB04_003259 [Centaurea solstitialis]
MDPCIGDNWMVQKDGGQDMDSLVLSNSFTPEAILTYTRISYTRPHSVSCSSGADWNQMQENSHESNFLKLEPLMVTSVHELKPVLQSVKKMNSLVLVFTRNLLCHFERLDICNYIFIGPSSGFLLDLSRRGHPVINVDRFLDGIKEYKSIKYGKEILVKAFVIKKALEMNSDTWVLDHNALPVKTDLFLDSFVVDSNIDIYIGRRLGLFFVKGSSSGVWTDRFVNKIARMVNTEASKDKSGFVSLVEKTLEMKGVRFERVDENGFGVEINDNGKSLKNETRVAFWSSDLRSGLIQERLVSLGLWITDDESNCR